MSNHDKVREQVSKDYARAVSEVSGGCCGPAKPSNPAAVLAGYSDEELSALPADAVQSSFGCGNPVAFSGVTKGETVLDLGSGAGIDLLLAADRVGPEGHVIGVDMTDAMIERARANVTAAGHTNVELRKGIIEDLPVESDTIDRVFSNCVVNLSPEKGRVFAEIARVLRAGGQISISDIVVEELPQWVRDSTHLHSACVAGAISESEYVAGLKAAGLEDVQVVDRMVYDTASLAALIGSEISGQEVSCCGVSSVDIDKDAVRRLSEEVQGKVWSARFVARKP